MATKVQKEDVWAVDLEDEPGSLAGKLQALSDAGADLTFAIARRTGTKKQKKGVLYVTPLKGRKQIAAARKAGFAKADGLHSLRIECPNRSGCGATLTQCVADAGINLRGLSAAAMGNKAVCHLAFDTSGDATRAARLLRKCCD